MKLNPRLKALAERILPHSVIACLDPVQDLIESEVRQASDRLKDGQIVLDAGAGEARHRVHFKRGRYVAMDVGCGDSSWDYSRLDIRGDLESIPLRHNSVDCILCMVVLEHTRNPRHVIQEFARVLNRGGSLVMVIPFLWEEHQAPHDYFRFTRYGARSLFESTSFQLDILDPIGGFFWVCARRSVGLLSFFQGGWRWILFAVLAPFFGFLFPLILYFMDGLDRAKNYSLGFRIRATKLD
ncbi:MAG: class I SAM-dependent methyltransferase [Acidobacteria bacterium]|nr:class I SAM-dependent methyltransferase [Acidobacteriota bacterium]